MAFGDGEVGWGVSERGQHSSVQGTRKRPGLRRWPHGHLTSSDQSGWCRYRSPPPEGTPPTAQRGAGWEGLMDSPTGEPGPLTLGIAHLFVPQMPKMLSILRSTENTPPIRTRPQPLPPLVAQLPSRCVPQVPCVLVYPHHEKVMAEGDPSLGKLQIQTCKAPPKLSAVESFGATLLYQPPLRSVASFVLLQDSFLGLNKKSVLGPPRRRSLGCCDQEQGCQKPRQGAC